VSTRQELEQAIVALEAQRAHLSEDVVEVAMKALREKLASLEDVPIIQQHGQICVLVADMSGFTSMSEFMDAEDVRDTINAVWQNLDEVVVSWGGKVDKHVGDSVIALFGVPVAQDDDAERAVQAALDMQMELALFNERMGRQNGASQLHHELRMRIGVHYGPVFWGQVGTSGEVTAVGDAVAVANSLEQRAPVGGVLVSQSIYEDVNVLDTTTLNGQMEPSRIYVVTREKPRAFRQGRGGTSFLGTRIVGRNEELTHLQEALRTTVETGTIQVVTVTGEAGIGKSRLLYEFEQLLTLSPEYLTLFKGSVRQSINQKPYGLIRDLLANYFDIHRRNSPSVAREKLARGIVSILDGDETQTLTQAHYIGHLLGFDFSDSSYLRESLSDERQLREYAFQDLAQFFKAVAGAHDTAVLFLEDVHWADEWSFDLLDYLIQECYETPLLVITLARPSLFERRPSWQVAESIDRTSSHHIELGPLSPIESRHLLTERLSQVNSLPLNLSDVIVNGAAGNPLHLEEIVKLLIMADVIDASGPQWRVRMDKLAEVTLDAPVTLPNLVKNRLSHAQPLERDTLQKAAVIGSVFWDMSLVHLHASEKAVSMDEMRSVLLQLCQQEWIYRRKSSAFTGVQEYAFRHDSLRDIIYETIPSIDCQACHAQVATWLITHGQQQTTEHAHLVAQHFERAEQFAQAAAWYGRAARRAQKEHAPETAVFHYCQSLNLLPVSADSAAKRMELNEGLGEMLRWQAHFVDAVEAYGAMQTAAHTIGDVQAETRALYALSLIHHFQGVHEIGLSYAIKAEALARRLDDPVSLVKALVSKGWAAISLGKRNTAVAAGKEAYALSKMETQPEAEAYSRALLGNIARETGHYGQALQAYQRARELFRQLNERTWEGLVVAQLGQVALEQYDLDTAASHFETCLHYARELGDYYGRILALRYLGRIAFLQMAPQAAEKWYQQGLLLAEKSENDVSRAELTCDLGTLYLAEAIETPHSSLDMVRREEYLQQAYVNLEQALKLARQLERPLLQSKAISGLALLFLQDHLLEEAQAQAVEAVKLTQGIIARQKGRQAQLAAARAWQVLGEILAKVPQQERQISLDDDSMNATACFRRSISILENIGQSAALERAQVWYVWATYEHHRGREARAKELSEQATAVFTRLNMHGKVKQLQDLLS